MKTIEEAAAALFADKAIRKTILADAEARDAIYGSPTASKNLRELTQAGMFSIATVPDELVDGAILAALTIAFELGRRVGIEQANGTKEVSELERLAKLEPEP